jgi:hypothetical protein
MTRSGSDPDLGDVIIRYEAAERLGPGGKIVGGHKVSEVRSRPVVAFVVSARLTAASLMVRFIG